jgi:hypothetical protein
MDCAIIEKQKEYYYITVIRRSEFGVWLPFQYQHLSPDNMFTQLRKNTIRTAKWNAPSHSSGGCIATGLEVWKYTDVNKICPPELFVAFSLQVAD